MDFEDILRLIFIVGGGIVLVIGKVAANNRRKQDAERKRQMPGTEPEPEQPVFRGFTGIPQQYPPQYPQQYPPQNQYFTYENDDDFRSSAAMRKQAEIKAAAAPAEEEKEGSATDFDLRTAVIASEILKPKFEE